MKTIQTKPDCTLGFVKNIGYNPTTQESFDGGKLNPFLIDEIGNGMPTLVTKSPGKPFHNPTVIGKLSEITEEQAKELLDSLIVNGFCCYKDYIEPNNSYFGASVLMSLKSAALSVGIEEKDFDKYLVVKL